jgi:predicted RNA binding protein YcfA (HicA-like mRNA interferase family)
MTAKFPVDAPKRKVVKALQYLGFKIVREKEHIPLTMPNHSKIKGSTLRTICVQLGISREEFVEAHLKS